MRSRMRLIRRIWTASLAVMISMSSISALAVTPAEEAAIGKTVSEDYEIMAANFAHVSMSNEEFATLAYDALNKALQSGKSADFVTAYKLIASLTPTQKVHFYILRYRDFYAQHFLDKGFAYFDVDKYILANPDVVDRSQNLDVQRHQALDHYLKYGIFEGRSSCTDFDPVVAIIAQTDAVTPMLVAPVPDAASLKQIQDAYAKVEGTTSTAAYKVDVTNGLPGAGYGYNILSIKKPGNNNKLPQVAIPEEKNESQGASNNDTPYVDPNIARIKRLKAAMDYALVVDDKNPKGPNGYTTWTNPSDGGDKYYKVNINPYYGIELYDENHTQMAANTSGNPYTDFVDTVDNIDIAMVRYAKAGFTSTDSIYYNHGTGIGTSHITDLDLVVNVEPLRQDVEYVMNDEGEVTSFNVYKDTIKNISYGLAAIGKAKDIKGMEGFASSNQYFDWVNPLYGWNSPSELYDDMVRAATGDNYSKDTAYLVFRGDIYKDKVEVNSDKEVFHVFKDVTGNDVALYQYAGSITSNTGVDSLITYNKIAEEDANAISFYHYYINKDTSEIREVETDGMALVRSVVFDATDVMLGFIDFYDRAKGEFKTDNGYAITVENNGEHYVASEVIIEDSTEYEKTKSEIGSSGHTKSELLAYDELIAATPAAYSAPVVYSAGDYEDEEEEESYVDRDNTTPALPQEGPVGEAGQGAPEDDVILAMMDAESEAEKTENSNTENTNTEKSESGTSENSSSESGTSTESGGAGETGTPESGNPSGTSESGTSESGTPESGTPESGTPESGTPESGDSETGTGSDDGSENTGSEESSESGSENAGI